MENYKELLEVARRDTGLGSFGDDSFREGLELLVGSLRKEAKLNDAGDRILRERILGHLKQRLQVEDWYSRHPEIEEVPLAAPLFGVSLPRTGSTALSFLLAQDPNARSLRQWEAIEPCPPPSTVEGVDPRLGRDDVTKQAQDYKSQIPTSGPNSPIECQDIMAMDFKSQVYLAFARVPTYAEWLMNADLTSTYLYERRVLKLLQWGFPARPWRLKAPTHLLYLKELDKAFPDARFVMTHRDPSDVILSVIDVYASIAGRFSDHVDLGYARDVNLEQWSEGMKRAMEFRRNGNHHRFYDIHFKAMHEDPIGEVRGLYEWLAEPIAPEFEAGMKSWWEENAASREARPKRDAATFGLDLQRVRPLFADYVAHLPEWTTRQAGHKNP